MGKVAALLHQPVHVWGMNFGIVDGTDRAEHQVVRDDEEEVRACISRLADSLHPFRFLEAGQRRRRGHPDKCASIQLISLSFFSSWHSHVSWHAEDRGRMPIAKMPARKPTLPSALFRAVEI